MRGDKQCLYYSFRFSFWFLTSHISITRGDKQCLYYSFRFSFRFLTSHISITRGDQQAELCRNPGISIYNKTKQRWVDDSTLNKGFITPPLAKIWVQSPKASFTWWTCLGIGFFYPVTFFNSLQIWIEIKKKTIMQLKISIFAKLWRVLILSVLLNNMNTVWIQH